MILTIKIHPNKKIAKIVKIADDSYEVNLKSRPIENKANLELLQLISDYFKVSKNQITFKSGLKSKFKTIEINE